MFDDFLYHGDCLEVTEWWPEESIDLIYLDPPFNSGQTYLLPDSWDVAFEDKWEWEEYMDFMRKRLSRLHDLLKPTGSLYLHCDPTVSHYLKVMLDEIFGQGNFRNEIVWRIGWVSGYKTQKRGWIRNHDIILYYVKSEEAIARFNKAYIPYRKDYLRRDGKKPTGKGIPIEDMWNCHKEDVLDSIQIKSFSKEKTGYPTQKPEALLERIIKASSNEGELVLDPFCGSGTTCVVAKRLGRRYIGIDSSKGAFNIAYKRL